MLHFKIDFEHELYHKQNSTNSNGTLRFFSFFILFLKLIFNSVDTHRILTLCWRWFNEKNQKYNSVKKLPYK